MENSIKDEYGKTIIWVDKYVRDMIHSSNHTSISASSSGDENWENEFSLLMQLEEPEEIPCVGPDHDGFDVSTPLVGTFCRGLFYYK